MTIAVLTISGVKTRFFMQISSQAGKATCGRMLLKKVTRWPLTLMGIIAALTRKKCIGIVCVRAVTRAAFSDVFFL